MNSEKSVFVNPVRVLKASELEKIVGARSDVSQYRMKGTGGNDNHNRLPE